VAPTKGRPETPGVVRIPKKKGRKRNEEAYLVHGVLVQAHDGGVCKSVKDLTCGSLAVHVLRPKQFQLKLFAVHGTNNIRQHCVQKGVREMGHQEGEGRRVTSLSTYLGGSSPLELTVHEGAAPKCTPFHPPCS
jgi:hypothetical protein